MLDEMASSQLLLKALPITRRFPKRRATTRNALTKLLLPPFLSDDLFQPADHRLTRPSTFGLDTLIPSDDGGARAGSFPAFGDVPVPFARGRAGGNVGEKLGGDERLGRGRERVEGGGSERGVRVEDAGRGVLL
jgi:hypothetical protein